MKFVNFVFSLYIFTDTLTTLSPEVLQLNVYHKYLSGPQHFNFINPNFIFFYKTTLNFKY